jgi:hypothetical protein
MIHIPFTAYARIIPDREHNKRRTYTRSLEKIATFVADDIAAYLEANPGAFWVNDPKYVFSTPQFAQKPARLTITGWDEQDMINFQPASQVLVDAPYTSAEDDAYDGVPGKTVEGYMGTQYLHPQGQTFNSQLQPLVSALKSALEDSSVYLTEIMRIDYMGVTFGETGHSFS